MMDDYKIGQEVEAWDGRTGEWKRGIYLGFDSNHAGFYSWRIGYIGDNSGQRNHAVGKTKVCIRPMKKGGN